ncbi:hypothetical protein BC939DRAFT_522174 [Gamsiella multidivaricata]|uniref:uncharacterized protein n=1 Tax=Gamsiella multidivaricata TaxID=101098 RepID=UPI00221EAA5F|nr:uncharacterized protein BC939DRAFT_522174 [Gamsiella multidivaricata]KAI7818478.1 hypothetical protein BC939DRAFT_522174 [Gamsiella multidivaricata]
MTLISPQMVEDIVVKDDAPFVIDHWHKHSTWESKLSTIPSLKRKACLGEYSVTHCCQMLVTYLLSLFSNGRTSPVLQLKLPAGITATWWTLTFLMQDYLATVLRSTVKSQLMSDYPLYAKDLSCSAKSGRSFLWIRSCPNVKDDCIEQKRY